MTAPCMPAPVLMAGTLAIDHIITPHDKAQGVLGGSVAYASVAAHLFNPQVDVLSIIGADFPAACIERLTNHGINLDRVDRRDGPSFSWTGEYYDRMNHRRTLAANDDVMTGWEVRVPPEWTNHSVVLACCMVPMRQLELIDQSKHARIVLSDSMDKWIDKQPELLDEVIAKSDICTMNEKEAERYTRTDSTLAAGRRLLSSGPQYVVIKQGEYGCMLFGGDPYDPELFRCPAWPLEQLTDPTGAGDSFLGALAGYLSTLDTRTPTFTDMKRAVIRASVAASFTCESFSADALLAMTRERFRQRLDRFDKMILPPSHDSASSR